MSATISQGRLAEIKARVPMPALVAERLPVYRAGGGEFLVLCPFHSEKTPSLRIYRDHAYCFGCGWYGDQFRWLMTHERLGFVGAVRHLMNWSGIVGFTTEDFDAVARQVDHGWRPICPVPVDAPPMFDCAGRAARVFNPKRAGERNEWSSWRPALVHPYRSESGGLLGYVLRIACSGGGKFTPTVTFCEDVTGNERLWCIVPFPRPLPLYGLDRLGRNPERRVVLVEGEKTADAAQRLLPRSVATTWPGGSKSYRHVDFSPLRGREVVCVPDADQPGRDAFHGRRDAAGKHVPGILRMLAEIGAVARIVEPEPGRPDGWDLADAEAEGWGTDRAIAWIRGRLLEVRDAA